MLDTATLGTIASAPSAPLSKELLTILRTGDWVPYLTWHHLEELISHGSDEVFRSRVDLLSRLAHLAYLQPVGHQSGEPYGGSVVDLRHYEIAALVARPNASHQDVIDAVWPSIRGGFVSGEQFVGANFDWWQIYRLDFAESRRLRKEQVANLTHFAPTDPKGTLPSAGED
jgi:hypothetical protein